MELKKIPINCISYPNRDLNGNELSILCGSFQLIGQIDPIIVNWRDDEQEYVLVHGYRRIRAAKKLGISELWAVVHEYNYEEFNLAKTHETITQEQIPELERADAVSRSLQFEKHLRSTDDLDAHLFHDLERVGAREAMRVDMRSRQLRERKIARISPRAKKLLRGMELENNGEFLTKLSEEKKSRQEKIVKLALEGISIDEAIKLVDKLEASGKNWPGSMQEVFTTYRRKLLKIATDIRTFQKEIDTRLKSITKDKRMSKIKPQADYLAEAFLDLNDIVLNNLVPAGPCPRCEYRGCPVCSYDGWANELIFKQEEAKSPTLYKRVKWQR